MRKFIVIEGTDGSGKQTQTALLKQYFESQGYSVLSQSFPNYSSPSCGPVKMYLGGQLCEDANGLDAYQSSILFAADRLCTMKQLERLDADIWLFDRYVESNMIHQGGKVKSIAELDNYINWLENLEYNTLGLPRPDMVLFLNMPPEKSIELAQARTTQKSGNAKDIHEKDTKHLVNAYCAGIYIAKMKNWTIIDCATKDGRIKTIEEVHQEIANTVEENAQCK